MDEQEPIQGELIAVEDTPLPEKKRAAKPIRRTKKSLKMEKAVALRARGASWDDIAQAMGWKDRRTASNQVYRYLGKLAKRSDANVDAFRQELIEKLDEVEKACWEVLRRKHIVIQNGKVVRLEGEDGSFEPVEDDAPVLQAVDRLLKVYERKAKLTGVDMTPDNMIGVAVQYQIQGTDISDYQ